MSLPADDVIELWLENLTATNDSFPLTGLSKRELQPSKLIALLSHVHVALDDVFFNFRFGSKSEFRYVNLRRDSITTTSVLT